METTDNQAKLLQLKASLGIWRKEPLWYKVEMNPFAKFGDSREYTVTYCTGRFGAEESYNCDVTKARSLIIALRRQGFEQIQYTYPELQDFFRNGERITGADLITDSFKDVPVPPTYIDPLVTSFQEMMNSLK